MPTHDPTAAGLYVLSDLHLAPPGEHCVFAAHEALVGLLDHVARQPAPQWLVLNGDVFDFLQIPGYDGLSLPLAPGRMAAILDALDAEPAGRNVVQALRRVSAAGHTLCCLPGNHDPELNLATVQQVLAERLGASRALPPAQGHWALAVAGRRVAGLHGHHGDPFNAISAHALLQAQAAGDATVPLPPGSRLVCELINPYRRAKDAQGRRRFPFVDLLPSEVAVVLALLLLDPALACRRLQAALGIGAGALVRAVMQRTGIADARLGAVAPQGAALAAHGAGGAPDGTEAWLADLAGAVAEAMTPAERSAPAMVEAQLRSHLDRGGAGGVSPDGLLSGDAGGWVAPLLWRALGRQLERGRDAFRPQQPDALAHEVIGSWGQAVVAITGHTHAAKQIATPQGGTYLNTGTWVDLVAMPAQTDGPAAQAWLQALCDGQVPRWQGCPVARVDADGARLLRWNGQQLDDWAAGLPAA